MSALPLVFWLSLLLPGFAIARRLVRTELEGGLLPGIAVSWMCALGALAPCIALGYVVRMPLWLLCAAIVAFVAWGAVDLVRTRAWRGAMGALLPVACIAGAIIAADIVLSDRHGAILDNDSRVHIARIRFLYLHGLSNADPFVRTPVEYAYPIYHTNILHALCAAGSRLLGVDPVTMWFNTLAASKLMIASGMAYLAWAILGGAWAPWVAAAMVVVNRGPYTFSLYPNQLAPWAFIPVAIGVLVRVLSAAWRGEQVGAWRAAMLVAAPSAVVGMTHPLYAGFLLVIAAPVAGAVALQRLVARREGRAPAVAAVAALVVVSAVFPLASAMMTARDTDRSVPRAQAQVDDGAERGADVREKTEDEEAAQLGKPRDAAQKPRASLVRPQEGFTFYERGERDWIARTFGRGFTGGAWGVKWWRLWFMVAGGMLAWWMLRRREWMLLAGCIAVVLIVMSVPPICTTALRFLGASWVLGRFETIAFVLWIPLGVPAIAAACERWRAWTKPQAALAFSALTLASVPVALEHASHRAPYAWPNYWRAARQSEGVRQGRQYAGLMKQKEWMDEAIPQDAVVLAGPLTGTWIAMLHGAGLVASERSSTGIASGKVRRGHIDEMFDPVTDEGRRAQLFDGYGVTHVLTRGRAPTWVRYWTVGGNRRHGHVVLTLRPKPDESLLWMREIEIARAQLDRGNAQGAADRLRAVLADHPRAADAWFTLGNAALALGQPREAVEAFASAEVHESDEPFHPLMLGNALFESGEFLRAAEAFERTREVALSGADRITAAAACFNLGNTLYELGRVAEALEEYQRALSYDPKHPKAPTALRWLRQDLGLEPVPLEEIAPAEEADAIRPQPVAPDAVPANAPANAPSTSPTP